MSDLELLGWAYLAFLVMVLIAIGCFIYTKRFDR